jgi:hypothetical protein
MRVFRDIVTDPAWAHRSELKRLPEWRPNEARTRDELFHELGLTYAAPYFHLREELAEKVDFVTSTQVLYYIPRVPLRHCIEFVCSILKRGGLFLAMVHLKDEYAAVDSTITKYNNLLYSPWVWEHIFNSRMMSYNRLKAPDYRELLEKTGFCIRHFEIDEATGEDLRELETIRVHPHFAKYSKRDLAAKHLFFAAEKV